MTPAQRRKRASYAAEARHARDRLRAIHAKAPSAVLIAGRGWYPEAEREARAIGELLPASLWVPCARPRARQRAGAGIIAALSPRKQWGANLDAARAIADGAAAGFTEAPNVTFGPNVAKAWRIAHGERPLDVLGGPKVRSFYANLSGDCEAVTLDVWAMRAALGRDLTPTPASYDRVASYYRDVAAELGEHPRDLQAIAWLAVRGGKPSDPELFRPPEPLDCEDRG